MGEVWGMGKNVKEVGGKGKGGGLEDEGWEWKVGVGRIDEVIRKIGI